VAVLVLNVVRRVRRQLCVALCRQPHGGDTDRADADRAVRTQRSCQAFDERTILALSDIAESYPRRSERLILAARMRFAEDVLAMTVCGSEHWN
jgi:hypothetical protein